MRLPFLVLLLAAVLFGSGYWYQIFDRVCDVPIGYRIGEVDPRFGTDREELARIAGNAAFLWEDRTGNDLFVYDEADGIPINLVFDERQENADIEAELREDLEAKEGMSADVAKKYDTLIAEFRKLKRSYESKVLSYETELATYNREVGEWNDKGGAPAEVVAELNGEAKALKEEQSELEALARQLNELVRQLNALGARANTLIADYNTVVREYNERAGEAEEFTQGDYTQDAINVYQFNSENELTLVLAHEFGHALSLGHVENEKSIMYSRMGEQSIKTGLSEEDVVEFERICKKDGFVSALMRVLRGIE